MVSIYTLRTIFAQGQATARESDSSIYCILHNNEPLSYNTYEVRRRENRSTTWRE